MTLSAAAQVVFCCVAKREDQTMPAGAKLLAWVEPQNGKVIAAFVAALASRPPATRRCASVGEARQWVEREADALGGVPIEWTEKAPHQPS
jgi:hypothetical protein